MMSAFCWAESGVRCTGWVFGALLVDLAAREELERVVVVFVLGFAVVLGFDAREGLLFLTAVFLVVGFFLVVGWVAIKISAMYSKPDYTFA